jgi:hypothetical protein
MWLVFKWLKNRLLADSGVVHTPGSEITNATLRQTHTCRSGIAVPHGWQFTGKLSRTLEIIQHSLTQLRRGGLHGFHDGRQIVGHDAGIYPVEREDVTG